MHEPSVPTPPAQAALPAPRSVASVGPAGRDAGDHDQPFAGFRPYQFSTRQLARLLQLRSELLDARLGLGRWVQDLGAA
jgi:hypothetical protein